MYVFVEYLWTFNEPNGRQSLSMDMIAWGVSMGQSAEGPSSRPVGDFSGPLIVLEYWWGHVWGRVGRWFGGIRQLLDVQPTAPPLVAQG